MEGNLLYSVLCISIAILATKFFLRTRKERKNLPPGPPSLPIVGHLHLLKQPLHRSLHNLTQKYGPIISLKFGSLFAVVVSSPAAVQECFTTNDIILANRPHFLLGKYVNYDNTTMGAANYGDHWRNLRRICATEMLSPASLATFVDIRRNEVEMLLRRLYRLSSHGFTKVELRPMFFDLTTNIIMRVVAGKGYYGEDERHTEEARQCRKLLEEFIECSETTNPGDLVPFFQYFDFGGTVKKFVSLGRRMDIFFQRLIDEHREEKDSNTMINHLFILQKSQPEYYTDEIIKGLILMMLTGGTETVALSLEWAFCNLLNHPNVLKKIKAELDTEVGQNRLVDESDFSKLRYLQCFISENLRLCPVIPLLVPHVSSGDCTIGGYHVPQGTMVLTNAWAIQRDPELWDDPTSFKPERFENGKVEACKLLPFGMGRRACPGEALADRVMSLALASMIQCFEWHRLDEKENDLSEEGTVTMRKAGPLELICKPYLNPTVTLS